MFRSLLYDHPQGLSLVLSAFTNFPLLASSFAFSVCGRMSSKYVCPVYLSVGYLVVHDQTTHRQVHRTLKRKLKYLHRV
jgi:hypothetical protein